MRFKCDDGKIVPFHSAIMYTKSGFVNEALMSYPDVVEIVVPFPAELVKRCLDVLYTGILSGSTNLKTGESSSLDLDMYGPFSYLEAHEPYLAAIMYTDDLKEPIGISKPIMERIELLTKWRAREGVHPVLRAKIIGEICDSAYNTQDIQYCDDAAFLDIISNMTTLWRKLNTITYRCQLMTGPERAKEKIRIRDVYMKALALSPIDIYSASYGATKLFVEAGAIEPIKEYILWEAIAGNRNLDRMGCKVIEFVSMCVTYSLSYCSGSTRDEIQLTEDEANAIMKHGLIRVTQEYGLA